jgi:hypothetical protein
LGVTAAGYFVLNGDFKNWWQPSSFFITYPHV